jgi:uncharacterized delta-60 repeat protein
VKALPDGRLLAGGRQNLSSDGFHVRRYLADGTVESGNILETSIAGASPGSCAFPDDGGIVLANTREVSWPVFHFVMGRVDSAMNPVPEFGGNGVVQTGIESIAYSPTRVLALPDGKILLVGTTPRAGDGTQWTALRFLSDGTPDSLFGTDGRTDVSFGPGGSDRCFDAAVDGDGRVLLAGRAHIGSLDAIGLARLLPDGSLDSTFSDDGKFATTDPVFSYLTRVLILPYGRILAAGHAGGSGGGDFLLARFIPFDPTGIGDPDAPPGRMSVRASPNPSARETMIHLRLPREQAVVVEIFDVAGRLIRRVFDGTLSPGAHRIPWDGRDNAGRETPAGLYFAGASVGSERQAAKLIRVR